MKIPSIQGKTDGWRKVENEKPEDVRELYIVVQKAENGELIRNAAWWEQDANGVWDFNKPGITHWMEWPKMP